MLLPLSALSTEDQDDGLPFHELLSDSEEHRENIIALVALGVLNLRKSFSGEEFTRAIYLEEEKNLYSDKRTAHMVLGEKNCPHDFDLSTLS